jgi:hypothetical protein
MHLNLVSYFLNDGLIVLFSRRSVSEFIDQIPQYFVIVSQQHRNLHLSLPFVSCFITPVSVLV